MSYTTRIDLQSNAHAETIKWVKESFGPRVVNKKIIWYTRFVGKVIYKFAMDHTGLVTNNWPVVISVTRFYFRNPEDAVAFKLRWHDLIV